MDSAANDVVDVQPSIFRVLAIAPILTLVFAVASLLATTSFVPRRSEGIRDVPDVAWSTYALIGNTIPILGSLILLAIIFRTLRDRILAWVIAAVFCYIAHATFLTNLLRRDFIGEF